MTRIALFVFAAWCTLAALFGLQLYFSLNSGIANPIVNPLVPLAKDVLWLASLLLLVTAAWQRRRVVYGRAFLYVSTLSTFTFAGLAFATYCRTGCDYAIFPLVKNLLLYSSGAVLAGYLLANLDLDVPALRIVLGALTAALLVSVLLFLTIEFDVKVQEMRPGIDVPILRLFGTFGNPNSAGWVAVLSAPLILLVPELMSYRFRRAIDAAALAALVVSFVVLFFSSSLSAVLGMGVAVLIVLAVEQRRDRLPRTIFHVGLASALGLGIAVALADMATPGHGLDIITRIVHLISGGSTESVGIRVLSYRDVVRDLDGFWEIVFGRGLQASPLFQQYDSVALTFLANFGFLGLLLFLAPYLHVLGVSTRRSNIVGGRASELCWRAFMPSYVSFMSVNLFLQHQLLLFPVNFFFCFLMGLCVAKISRYSAR